ECIDDTRQEIECNESGVNRNKVRERFCTEGQWGSLSTECFDPDQCANGDTQRTVCGADDHGLRFEECVDGAWNVEEVPCRQRAKTIVQTYQGFAILSLDATNQVFAWGDNTDNRLLAEDNDAASVQYHTLPVASDMEHRDFRASGTHQCYLLSGKLYCWGDNRYGQIGIDPEVTEYVDARVQVTLPSEDTGNIYGVAVGSGFTCVDA